MFHYKMSRKEALELPNRTFWFMAGTIGRLLAESDLRFMATSQAAQSEDGFEETRKRLVMEMNAERPEDPLEAKLDKAGLDELRTLF